MVREVSHGLQRFRAKSPAGLLKVMTAVSAITTWACYLVFKDRATSLLLQPFVACCNFLLSTALLRRHQLLCFDAASYFYCFHPGFISESDATEPPGLSPSTAGGAAYIRSFARRSSSFSFPFGSDFRAFASRPRSRMRPKELPASGEPAQRERGRDDLDGLGRAVKSDRAASFSPARSAAPGVFPLHGGRGGPKEPPLLLPKPRLSARSVWGR